MMLYMEGMDMYMETPNSVWSILGPLVVNPLQWAQVEQDQEEGSDPQLEGLNSGS